MAKFNYDQYAAQQQSRNTSGSGNNANREGNRPEVKFFGEFMRNDGDVVVVRFPYASMSDVCFETTHLVKFPGRQYGARVSCPGDNCPLCAEGIKIDTRCFVKGLIYEVDNEGKMNRYNAIWDRPSAFADIDIKNLIQEYGDLTQVLIKIKKNGTGLNTRYTTSVVMPNNSIYNASTCVADFTELNSIDATRILCKTLAQYNEAINPSADGNKAVNEVNAAAKQEATNINVANESAPGPHVETTTTPAYESAHNTVQQPEVSSQAAPAAAPQRQQRRYQF